jgi:TonB family protein
MLSKTLFTLLCGVSLAAQTPSPLQDSLKAARAAAREGDIDDALNQFRSAFELAASSDPRRIPGIAIEAADLLQSNKRPGEAESVLLHAADFGESKGLPASAEVPIANRLYHLGAPLNAAGQNAEAKQALERSLTILRNAYGPDAPSVSTVLNALAATNAHLGDTGLAMQERAEAAQIQSNQTLSGLARTAVPPGPGITPPRVVSKVDPAYSESAREIHYTGTVLLSLVVMPDGAPVNVQILLPLGAGLDEKAVEAVNQWRFQPGTRKSDGQPIAVQAQVELNFRLL